MLAAHIEAPGQARIVIAPQPTVGPHDVMIRVAAAGICGTDLHIYRGEYEAKYPLIPGHEFSGTVVEVGEAVTRYQSGDRVSADPNIACGRCYFCQRNEPNQCETLAAIGVTRNGGFAEYVVAPEENVFSIGNMSFAAAALIEPLACVVWGLKMVDVQPGDSVLIFGAGPMGCMIIQALRVAGAANIVITSGTQWRLDQAAALGATETVLAKDPELQAKQLKAIAPRGFDIVVDATGLSKVVEQGLGYLKSRGKFWVFGVTPPNERASFIPYDFFRRDLRLIGSFAVNRTFPPAIDLIQYGVIDVEKLISHRMPLENFCEGLELAEHDPKRMKVQFELS